MMSKRQKNWIVFGLFLFSWVSSWMLTLATRKAIADSWPFMESFLAFTPILSFFATLLSFFLLTRLLRALCAIALYYGGIELAAREFQFSIYLSTAIPSAAAFAQWALIATGILAMQITDMPGSPGAVLSPWSIIKGAMMPGLPLLILQAGLIVLMMWKDAPEKKRPRLILCIGAGACAFWLLGLLAQLGLSWLMAGY